MANYILLAFAGLAIAYLANNYRCYAINLAAAKKSGFPYITMPVHTFNRFWLITHRLWLPIINLLPKSWLHPWIECVLHFNPRASLRQPRANDADTAMVANTVRIGTQCRNGSGRNSTTHFA